MNFTRTLSAFALLSGCGAEAVEFAVDDMLAAHNAVRLEYGVAALSADVVLADTALEWSRQLSADGCDLVHSEGEYGENLYWTSATATPEEVVTAWASEVADYDLGTHTCAEGAVCGHFTQVVWANTTTVGCGSAVCADGGEVWTCEYDPPGNYVGETPF